MISLPQLTLNDRPRAFEDLSEAAKGYTSEGDYDKAIVCYTNLLGLVDQDLESFYNRGICYLRLGRYPKSISDLKKTIELDKKFFLGHLHLGEAYYKSGNYEASLKRLILPKGKNRLPKKVIKNSKSFPPI